MKSELVENNKARLAFPLLAKNKGRDLVVLFTNKTSGTVVHGEGIGRYSENWNDVTSYHWEILPSGSRIIIVQE